MKRYLLPVVGIVFLSLGLIAAFLLSRQTATVNNNAATPTGTGTITLTPANGTHYVGDLFSTAVKMNTGGAAVAALQFSISYPYTGATPQLDVVDSTGAVSNKIFPDAALLSSGSWSFNVNSVTRTSNTVTINFAAVSQTTTGFSSSSDTNLATIYFKVNAAAASNPLTISFDPTQSLMYTKSNPTDILKTPTNASYTIIADTTAPNAISDLQATGTTTNSTTLSWTAPSDVGPVGKAASYDVRYSTTAITAANWSSATVVANPPVPATAGTVQTLAINNLNQNTTYYFGIKSTDAAGNISNLSNVINTTTSSPTLTFGFKMQAITAAGINKTVAVTVTNANGTGNYSVPFTTDANGIFRPTSLITLTGITIGTTPFDVYVKDGSHLRKKLGTITLTNGVNTAPSSWDNTTMLIGDFNASNTLDISDVGSILSVYTSLSVPVNANNQIYDVNADGTINIVDIALTLSNYTALTVNGD